MVAPGASDSGQPSAPWPGGEAGRRVDRVAGRGPQKTCHPVPFRPCAKGETEAQRGQLRNWPNMAEVGRG